MGASPYAVPMNAFDPLWRAKMKGLEMYSALERRLLLQGWLSRESLMLPEFLCIGAPQSGTTWLYQNLKAHPEIFLPDRKELRQFEPINDHLNLKYHYSKRFTPGRGKVKGDMSPGYSVLAPERIRLIRKLMPEVRLIFIRRDPVERTWAALRRAFSRPLFDVRDHGGSNFRADLNKGRVPHYFRYYFSAKGCDLSGLVDVSVIKRDDEWRVDDGCRRLSYTIVAEGDEFNAYISTIENRKRLVEGRFDELDETPVMAYLKSEHQAKLNNYASILHNWLTVYPRDSLYVIEFERIAREPRQLLREVFSHIGVSLDVDLDKFPYSEQINRNKQVQMPERYRKLLESLYGANGVVEV